MTDSPTTEPIVDSTPDPDEPKGLRKQLGEAHAKIKELEADKLTAAFDEIGMDPTKGLGKAVAKEYDGEISTEALSQYIQDEYGVEPQAQAPADPVAQEIQTQQAAIDAASAGAGSVVAPTQAELLAKAEAEGDVQTTMALKGQQVADMF